MKYSGYCPKCNGAEIVRVTGENQSKIGIPAGLVSWVPVARYICLQCGYLEQYVDDVDSMQKLAKAYRGK